MNWIEDVNGNLINLALVQSAVRGTTLRDRDPLATPIKVNDKQTEPTLSLFTVSETGDAAFIYYGSDAETMAVRIGKSVLGK